MKILKKIVFLAAISLIIQISLFYFIDRNLRHYKINIESINENIQKSNKLDIIQIPNNAKNIDISNSGKYLSYSIGEYVYMINTYSCTSNKVFLGKNYVLDSCKWLTNRERLIIVKKKVDNSNQYEYMLSYYDADSEVFEDISHITWSDKSLSPTSEIMVSQTTGLVYVKIESQNSLDIYSIDTMGRIDKVDLDGNKVRSIDVSEKNGNLVFQDIYGKIFIRVNEGFKNIFINYKDLTFIGIDVNDIIYLANVQDGKVYNILYGSVNDTKLEKIKLNKIYDIEDVILLKNGEIYINDKNNNSIFNIKSRNEIKYNGKLLKVYESGIISLLDNKVIKTYFKINK